MVASQEARGAIILAGFGAGSGLGAAGYYGSGRYGANPPGSARPFITGVGVPGGIAGAVIGLVQLLLPKLSGRASP